ncbi:MAG: hypothetical protein HON90_13830 [Halobacteriovoraceae bacterium]|jgi:uncharacterized protein|nr:hypothetical protein [Halobacteriovoraceae bacterium]
MNCPNCKTDSLFTKEYELIKIDQCKLCHGTWLDQGEICEIIKNRATDFSEAEIAKTVGLAFSGIPTKELEQKRNCPKCNKKLNTVNYTCDSGIIIDVCPSEHGMWLDKRELEQIQHYREYWIDKISDNYEKLIPLIQTKSNRPKNDDQASLLFNLASSVAELIKK